MRGDAERVADMLEAAEKLEDQGAGAGSLTVVVPCTLADQPDEARQTVLSATRRALRMSLVGLGAPRLDMEAYHAHNRWMVDRSDLIIGFPRGDDRRSGTWYTIHYGAEQGRPRLIVPI